MTREEILLGLKSIAAGEGLYDDRSPSRRALILGEAIKTLEQEPSVDPQGPKTDIFDKIRAEIIEEKECAYADFERYKVEYLGQDWEDVYDSLPQDDFRFGMGRTVDIIDKYRQEG